jgi:chromatin remodeling complex protein RSC6
MYKYIKDNQLQGVDDTRTIYPNEELKKLFNLNDDEQLSFYNIQTHIKKIYSNKMDKNRNLIIISEDMDKNDDMLNTSDNLSSCDATKHSFEGATPLDKV